MTNKIPKHSQESSRMGNVPVNEVSVLSTHPDTNNKIPQEIEECYYCKKPNTKGHFRKISKGKSYICHKDCWLKAEIENGGNDGKED